jgi:hypothetical protein
MLKDFPAPLLKRLIFTLLSGAGFLIVGAVFSLLSTDVITAGLSLLIFFGCVIRAYTLYRLVRNNSYETIEGVCMGIHAKPFGKYRTVRIADDDGLESNIKLRKSERLYIGARYRFYFRQNDRESDVYEFRLPLQTGMYLGMEKLSEESCSNNKPPERELTNSE